MPASSSEQSASSARQRGILYPIRLLAVSLVGTAVISAVLVIPGWIPTLSRPVRRELTEAILQTVLVVYSVLFLVALRWNGSSWGGSWHAHFECTRSDRESRGCSWPACRASSGSFFWKSAQPGGGPGCTGFPACRPTSSPVRPTNTGSLSSGVRVQPVSRTGRGCRWARSWPGSFREAVR